MALQVHHVGSQVSLILFCPQIILYKTSFLVSAQFIDLIVGQSKYTFREVCSQQKQNKLEVCKNILQAKVILLLIYTSNYQ